MYKKNKKNLKEKLVKMESDKLIKKQKKDNKVKVHITQNFQPKKISKSKKIQ